MEPFPCLYMGNYQIEMHRFKCKMCILCCLCFFPPIWKFVVKLGHTTLFIVCHLHVCNLSPVPSKQCGHDARHVPVLWQYCASATHWLESHLASVCLITFWHFFLTLPPLSSFLLFFECESSFPLCQKQLSFSLIFHCVLYSAVSALNAKLNWAHLYPDLRLVWDIKFVQW